EVFSATGVDVEPVSYILAHPDQLASKMNYQLAQTVDDLWRGGLQQQPTVIDAIEIGILLLGVILPRRNETARQRLFRWTIYLCIASALLLGSITYLRWRHLYGFLPVALIFISELVLRITDLKRPRLQFLVNPLFVIAVLTVAFAIPSWNGILQTVHTGQALDREYRQLAALVQNNTPPNAIVLIRRGNASLGMQNALGWYAKREVAEFDPFTLDYFQAQRGSRPLYFLAVTEKPRALDNTLVR